MHPCAHPNAWAGNRILPGVWASPAGGSVSYRTRHGVTLSLNWDGPFLVDGRPADLALAGQPAEPPHLDNPLVRLPFGAPDLVIGDGEHRHVINLRSGRPVLDLP